MLSFAITVVLNVIIENSLYKSKGPLPDNREAVTRLYLVGGYAVNCSSRLCLRTPQHLVGCADDLGKARPRATQTIDSLRRSKLSLRHLGVDHGQEPVRERGADRPCEEPPIRDSVGEGGRFCAQFPVSPGDDLADGPGVDLADGCCRVSRPRFNAADSSSAMTCSRRRVVSSDATELPIGTSE